MISKPPPLGRCCGKGGGDRSFVEISTPRPSGPQGEKKRGGYLDTRDRYSSKGGDGGEENEKKKGGEGEGRDDDDDDKAGVAKSYTIPDLSFYSK